MEKGEVIQRLLIPNSALSETLEEGPKKEYVNDIYEASKDLSKLGVRTVVVREPTKLSTSWQLGGASSGWVIPDDQDKTSIAESETAFLVSQNQI